MADISRKIARKSIKAKQKAAIKTIKAQAKEKIRQVKIEYALNPERQLKNKELKERKKEKRIQRTNARFAYNSRQPNKFSLGEDLFNSISHGLGAGLCVAAIALLAVRAAFHTPKTNLIITYQTAFGLFSVFMAMFYLSSTLYHALTPLKPRKVFSVINRIAFYGLIGATWTAILLPRLQGSLRISIIAGLWTACTVLALLYSALKEKISTFGFVSYIILGWVFVGAFEFIPDAFAIPEISYILFFTGSAMYSVAALFMLMRNYKWMHSIGHLFTLAGSILHFFSIYYSI